MIDTITFLINLTDEEISAIESQVVFLGIFKRLHLAGYDVMGTPIRYCMCGTCDNLGEFMYYALSCIFGSNITIDYIGTRQENPHIFPEFQKKKTRKKGKKKEEEEEDLFGLYEIEIEDPLATLSVIQDLPIENSSWADEPVIAKYEITEKGWRFWIFDDLWPVLTLITDFFLPLHQREQAIEGGEAA